MPSVYQRPGGPTRLGAATWTPHDVAAMLRRGPVHLTVGEADDLAAHVLPLVVERPDPLPSAGDVASVIRHHPDSASLSLDECTQLGRAVVQYLADPDR
jgi:hypothetical protein